MKTFNLKLILVSLLILFSFFTISANAQVKLLKAEGQQFCSTCYGMKVDILVENLAYEKYVGIATHNGDGDWFDLEAEFVESVGGNWELWQVQAYEGYPEHDIAAKYVVNGIEYWDSNNGDNYFVDTYKQILGSHFNVLQLYATRHTCYRTCYEYDIDDYVGRILVRNIAYDKNIKIVYSTDDWATVQTADAKYSEMLDDDFETWTFHIPRDLVPNAFQYAIAYEVAGKTFWDSNFGNNYLGE